MNRSILAAMVVAALAGTRASAQVTAADVRQIPSGSRVRVSAVAAEDREARREESGRHWRVGELREVTDDGLVLQTSGQRVDIPFGLIQEVQVSRGRLDVGGGAKRGAVQGALGGALAGAVFQGLKQVLNTCGEGLCEHDSDVLGTSTSAMVRDIGGGAVLGALVGAAAGSRSREVWVPAARHVTVGSAPGGGARMGLAFRL